MLPTAYVGSGDACRDFVKADPFNGWRPYVSSIDERELHMNRSADDNTADDTGSAKPGGLGQDGTIPAAPDGVAAGHTGEPSTFEPEEDEMAPSEDEG
jgi:hypothetical protein